MDPLLSDDLTDLRDHFAGVALCGLLAAESDANGTGAFSIANGKPSLNGKPESFAAAAYLLADAMLYERARRPLAET
jgi:hypothetical protein